MVDGMLPFGDILYWIVVGILSFEVLLYYFNSGLRYNDSIFDGIVSDAPDVATENSDGPISGSASPNPDPHHKKDNKYDGGSTYNKDGIRID